MRLEVMKNKESDSCIDISKDQVESLARCLLPEIQQFFESTDGKKEFEVWKAKQAKSAEQITE